MSCRTLYRPVGWRELELIRDSGWSAFPPRLEWQPIFYPVLNEAYAAQIAREWNTEDAFSGYCGIVTAFELPADFLDRYEVQHVGGNGHDELWVPAADLDELNHRIDGKIRITAAFVGMQFKPADALLYETIKPFLA